MSSNQLQDELTGFCRSHALSLDGLRAIFEGHEVRPNPDNPNISYEFFHEACLNKKITEGILRYLLEYFPNAVRYTDGYVNDGEEGRVGGCTPLHSICFNKNVTLSKVQLLIDAFPESLRHENSCGCMPLHVLSDNKHLDKEGGLEILKLFLERCPESVRHAAQDIGGILPIHIAAAVQSPEFCRVLIEACPGSERMVADVGLLPFHAACAANTVATAEYLYQLYPESINVTDNVIGSFPIHHVISGLQYRTNPKTAVEVTQFLLDCNPGAALQEVKVNGTLPLVILHRWICENEGDIVENLSKMNTCLKILQLLYDAHPDAIEDNRVRTNTICVEIQTFIDTQLSYARHAKDRNIMTTRDEHNGKLLLHRAFYDNIPLGKIKLLVKGNPSAISCADNIGMMPLHSACKHRGTPAVVEFLINLYPTSLRARDFDDNTALHYACLGANHSIIALLTEKYGAISVSKRNAHGQLPIDLLFASNAVSDRENVEYIESIFRLLRAYPATVMNCIHNATTTSHSDSKVSGKKRKIDYAEEEGEGY